MGITFSDPDVDSDENVVQIAALTPTDNGVIIGDGAAWTVESGATLRASLGLAIGTDVQAYDADLDSWAGVSPSSYSTTAQIAAAYQPLDADLTTWAGVTPGTGVATALAVNVGTAGAPVINGGALGTPSSGTLTSATGLPVSTGISGLGTGIATALAINTGSAGAPVLFNGALGTPASGTLTNCTGLPNASVVGLGTAAVVNTGTSGATIPLLNGANTHSGLNTFSGTGQRMTFTGAATSAVYADFVNTTGRLIIGIDNSAGGNFFGGSSAYASIISSQANTALILATNSLPRMTISAAGSVTVGGAFASDSVQVANALGITFTRPTFAQWQMVHGTANTMAGWGVLQATAGLYAMWIAESTQNVGIGTVDPTARLHVAGTVRFSSLGAGTVVTDSSGNISASSDESLKYIVGGFSRGLADLRNMDRPINYQWRSEQIELAEAMGALNDTEAKLAAAHARLVATARVAQKKEATEADQEEHRAAQQAVTHLASALADQRYRASLTREEATYTGWTAQGVRKGIPEAVKAGPDGLLNFDERPVLAAMFNALLEMAARIEALEAAP